VAARRVIFHGCWDLKAIALAENAGLENILRLCRDSGEGRWTSMRDRGAVPGMCFRGAICALPLARITPWRERTDSAMRHAFGASEGRDLRRAATQAPAVIGKLPTPPRRFCTRCDSSAANGELTKRLIVTAMYNLARPNLLPQRNSLSSGVYFRWRRQWTAICAGSRSYKKRRRPRDCGVIRRSRPMSPGDSKSPNITAAWGHEAQRSEQDQTSGNVLFYRCGRPVVKHASMA